MGKQETVHSISLDSVSLEVKTPLWLPQSHSSRRTHGRHMPELLANACYVLSDSRQRKSQQKDTMWTRWHPTLVICCTAKKHGTAYAIAYWAPAGSLKFRQPLYYMGFSMPNFLCRFSLLLGCPSHLCWTGQSTSVWIRKVLFPVLCSGSLSFWY